jgi:hypothetical protein
MMPRTAATVTIFVILSRTDGEESLTISARWEAEMTRDVSLRST